MRIATNLAIGLALLVAWGATGCAEPKKQERLNAPPQGEGVRHSDFAKAWAYHKDQGMLADMSIADMHFIPHSSYLSGAGEARLERYAELLATSGGSIAYQTSLRDSELIKARLAVAKDFLAEAIPGGARIETVIGLAGGRGMTAAEASMGRAVAEQAEPRATAYHLNVSSGSED